MRPTLVSIQQEVEEADRLRSLAETMITNAVRSAAAVGFSQREIAQATGRSQPEISRLIRFRGTSPLGIRLRKHRVEILAIAREFALENIEVFGSVARGDDGPDSDIDLLCTTRHSQTLLTYAAAESAMTKVLGVHVDLVPRHDLKPHVRHLALKEAIPL